jgi:TPR repeat protein
VRDISRGLSLLRESASLGHADSVFARGFYLPEGGVYPGKREESAAYYRRSTLAGNSFGQFKYGWCLERGHGIAKNETEAVKYYKLAADHGYTGVKSHSGP